MFLRTTLPTRRTDHEGTPAGSMGPIRSYCPIAIGLPCIHARSTPALSVSGPAQRLLTLWPARSPSRHRDPLHRRLQQFRHLHHCFGCYRAERTSSQVGLAPAEDQCLLTAHMNPALVISSGAQRKCSLLTRQMFIGWLNSVGMAGLGRGCITEEM
jgi:hypothetical protein